MSLREHKNHVNVNCEKISVDLQEVELDSCTYYLRSIVEV
jgi:DNA-binding NtrC family response regulator